MLPARDIMETLGAVERLEYDPAPLTLQLGSLPVRPCRLCQGPRTSFTVSRILPARDIVETLGVVERLEYDPAPLTLPLG